MNIRSFKSAGLVRCGILLVSAAAALNACGGAGHSESARSVGGDLTILDPALASGNVGGPCSGVGGYSDIREGTSVVVRNAEGRIVGTGQLAAGELIGRNGSTKAGDECQFAIEVAGVPVSHFYEIEVSHRGAQTFSRAELDSADWQVHLRLGP